MGSLSRRWTQVLCLTSMILFEGNFFNAPAVRADDPLSIVVAPDPPLDEFDNNFPNNPIDFFDNYSWRIFASLNWPATANQRGEPDRSKGFRDNPDAPRVWETWKSAEELFYTPGGRSDPAPTEWTSVEGPSLCPSIASAESGKVKMLANFTKVGTALADLNQVDNLGLPVAPLVAQNRTYVRYEIRMNQKQYDFIRDGKLYIRNNLPKSQDPQLVFPDSSIEIKAAWRELRSDESADVIKRYYHVKALAINPKTKKCEEKTFGLVGFHIAQKTPTRRQWIWSTFEHVDNITPPTGIKPSFNDPNGSQTGAIGQPPVVNEQNPPLDDPQPVQVFRQFPLPPETQQTNKKWHDDPQIKGTVWENYDLVFTQWPILKRTEEGIGNPFPSQRVYNTTMETYMQSSSCIACHRQTTEKTDFVWFLADRAFESSKTSDHAKAVKDSTNKALHNP